MTRLLQHYAIEDARVGVATIKIMGLRCANCMADFNIDKEPKYCPECGTQVSCILPFGSASQVPA
jgi:rRNA maturation endonuclease Nob1